MGHQPDKSPSPGGRTCIALQDQKIAVSAVVNLVELIAIGDRGWGVGNGKFIGDRYHIPLLPVSLTEIKIFVVEKKRRIELWIALEASKVQDSAAPRDPIAGVQ